MNGRFICIITAVILLIGCASSSGSGTGETEITETVVEETPVEPVFETVYIPMLLKEESYFETEYVKSVEEFTYKGNFLAGSVLKDTYGDVIESAAYIYDSGSNPAKIEKYGSDGKLKGYTDYSYTESGQTKEEVSYDKTGKRLMGSRYTYDEAGRKIEWEVLGESGSSVAITKYYYDGGRLIKIENLNPGGEIQEYYELSYEDDLPKSKTYYTGIGVVSGSEEYSYTGKAASETVYMRANGSVKRIESYTYDEHGSVISVEYMDSGRNIQEMIKREYGYREEQREVTGE